jgi:hypothetical protein
MTRIFADAALAAAAFGALLSATAAASAAPTIAGSYYAEKVSKVCTGVSFCELTFTAVPAGKSLIVTDIGCVATLPSTQALAAISAQGRKADNSPVPLNAYIQTVLFSNLDGTKRYQAQTEVTHILTATQKPTITASKSAAAGEFIVACTIAGVLQ